ncbi:ribosomal-protein-alanine N-acetyltransferase [Nakamurella sp. UYEF19]|uniref:GNAT family N-acetyltransferase n=1 Tax=Nakamurella sp. UYEF19 TaxID=1756392 RepID=UPI00339A551F
MTADGWPSAGRHPGWPAKLGPVQVRAGAVGLRPLRRSDGDRWQLIRIRDEALISPWDATSALSWADRHTRVQWHSHRTLLMSASRRGEVLPFVIELGGQFIGQITVGGIQRGALRSAWVGYWVDSTVQGGGVATAAVALAVGHAFGPVGLHRVEATIAPENTASQAVVTHVGFRQEGYLQRYLDINGSWRDHLLYAMTREEVPGGTADLLARWSVLRRGAGPTPF